VKGEQIVVEADSPVTSRTFHQRCLQESPVLSSRGSASIPSILEPQTLAVLQEDSLFAGSLADNIALFEDSPDVERIHLSAAAAPVPNDIVQMPMGYGTLVGVMGFTLSGDKSSSAPGADHELASVNCRNGRSGRPPSR
jgi:hypothetical protein